MKHVHIFAFALLFSLISFLGGVSSVDSCKEFTDRHAAFDKEVELHSTKSNEWNEARSKGVPVSGYDVIARFGANHTMTLSNKGNLKGSAIVIRVEYKLANRKYWLDSGKSCSLSGATFPQFSKPGAPVYLKSTTGVWVLLGIHKS
jgi:hypothetical protein